MLNWLNFKSITPNSTHMKKNETLSNFLILIISVTFSVAGISKAFDINRFLSGIRPLPFLIKASDSELLLLSIILIVLETGIAALIWVERFRLGILIISSALLVSFSFFLFL